MLYLFLDKKSKNNSRYFGDIGEYLLCAMHFIYTYVSPQVSSVIWSFSAAVTLKKQKFRIRARLENVFKLG